MLFFSLFSNKISGQHVKDDSFSVPEVDISWLSCRSLKLRA